jgi:transglutaminase-like putative cysteine protease
MNKIPATFILFSICLLIPKIGFSQDAPVPPDSVATATSETAPIYATPQRNVWEFGLKVTASGPARGVTATVPIPREWPEQSITGSTTEKSDNVANVKIDEPTDGSRQIIFEVPLMDAGETAEVIMRFELTKQMMIAPNEPSHLKFSAKPPKEFKPFLKPSPQIESTHRRIKAIAAELRDESLPAWQQVETVYKWVRENIEYEFDTEIHSCLDALDAKKGDCEELASLFIAICRAMGIPARAVWIPGHTYPEFYLEDEGGNGHWFPCQVAGTYQFGAMTEVRPVLQKGDKFRLPGKSGYVRYLQPTLRAKDSRGELGIDWISREVEE